MKRTYHGWLVLEPQGEGMNDQVFTEYLNAGGKRDRQGFGYGNRGCVRAIEWFDKRAGQPVKLEPMLKGMHRVYTEAPEPRIVWVLEQMNGRSCWELVSVHESLASAQHGKGDLIWTVDPSRNDSGCLSAVTVNDEPAYYITRLEVTR